MTDEYENGKRLIVLFWFIFRKKNYLPHFSVNTLKKKSGITVTLLEIIFRIVKHTLEVVH
jgi:hypothetical protein